MKSLKEKADDEVYELESAYVEIYEDSYEEGEGDFANSYDFLKEFRIKTKFSSISDLIAMLGDQGFGYSTKDYSYYNGTISGSLLGDNDNYPVKENSKEFKLWKEGNLTLYVQHLTCVIKITRSVYLLEDEAKDLGFDIQ
jgi:hypothetical protein